MLYWKHEHQDGQAGIPVPLLPHDGTREHAPPYIGMLSQGVQLDFLPRLKAGDSYAVWINEAVQFGGFLFHWRPRCGRLAPASVLRRLHRRLATRQVLPRRVCSMRRSSLGRAAHRIGGNPIRVRLTASCRPCVRIVSRFDCWDTSGLSGRWFFHTGCPIAVSGR